MLLFVGERDCLFVCLFGGNECLLGVRGSKSANATGFVVTVEFELFSVAF